MVGWTLRTITDLFDGADVPRGEIPPGAVSVSGERRSLVEEYYAGVDWSSPRDIRKVLRAYEEILVGLERSIDSDSYLGGPYHDQQKKDFQKLTTLLKRDGYVYENGQLVPMVGVDLKALEDASEVVDRRTLREHIQRIEQSVEHDPAQAIGSAKELVETVAKHILTCYGQDPDRYDTLQQLVKQALRCLDLSVENLPDNKKGAESIRQVLSGLSQIVGGTAELRNLYGPDTDARGLVVSNLITPGSL